MDPTQDPQAQNPQAGGAQSTGTQPAGAQPAGAQPAAQGAAEVSQNLSGIMEENVDISSLIQNAGNPQSQQDFISRVKVPAHPNTTFDEKRFIELLAGSISLTIQEKERIIQAIPQLSQFQIDELIKIFDEEKAKFTELEKKHADQVAELEKMHSEGWQDLEAKKAEETATEDEARKQEEIRKQLGL